MAPTFAGAIVPVTVAAAPPVGTGQVWVPGEPLLRFVQKKTITPPGTCLLPKWIWDWLIGALKPEYDSLNVMVRAFRLRSSWSVPFPEEKIAPVSLLSAPTSSNPENFAENSSALA